MSESLRKEVIEYTLTRLDEIDAKYETTSEKSSQWRKAANKIHKDLLSEGKDKKPVITANTYHSYLTAIRNAIKETGRKHPALTSPMNRKGYLAHAIKRLPDYENELKALAKMPAATVGQGKHQLKEQMHQELKGAQLDTAIDLVDGLLVDHPLVTMLTKSKARKEQRAKTETESLTSKSQHMKEYNFPAVLGLAESCLEDESYTALAWGLALLTGRRSAEILYHAKFTKVDSQTVTFSGQLKKRQGTQAEAFNIPVLADADKIIKALKRLRNMEEVARFKNGTVRLDGEDVPADKLAKRDLNRAINQSTNGVLNDRAKNLMKDKAEVFKNTRGIYARYCSDQIRPTSKHWEGYNEDEFLKAILGHESTDEVKHYRQVSLAFEDNGDWLKVKEEKEDTGGDDNDQEPEQAKKNWRATKGLKDMREALDALDGKPVELAVGKNTRKVKASTIIDFHDSQLRFWCAENPTLKITQSAVEKNKGNTLESGTGTVNVRVNRMTFKAWVQAVGADAVAAYNEGKE
jgi:hypothetical protein